MPRHDFGSPGLIGEDAPIGIDRVPHHRLRVVGENLPVGRQTPGAIPVAMREESEAPNGNEGPAAKDTAERRGMAADPALAGSVTSGAAAPVAWNVANLRIFLAACELGSFSRTAHWLGLSQPAVSRTVRSLEKAAGVTLFRRNGRGVQLTEVGRILREHARRVVHENAEMAAALAQLSGEELGEVKVLLPFYVGRILVPPMIARFTEMFPHASIRIFEGAAVETPRRLTAGEAELGLFYSPPGRSMPTSEPVAVEHIYLVGLPDLLGRDSRPITLAEAASLPLILPSQHTPFRALVDAAAQRVGLRLRVEHELELSYAQLAFVLEGKGATMIPYSHCYEEIERAVIVARPIVTPAISRDILLASGSKAAGRLTRGAFDILRRVIAEHRPAFRWLEPA